MKNKRFVCILVIIEIIIIILLLLPFGKERFQFYYDFNDMIDYSQKGRVVAEGIKIDENRGYTGMFTCNPFFDLPRGSYRITIFYETDCTGNTATLSCNSYSSFDALICDDIILSPNKKSVTFNAYSKEMISASQIVSRYNGSGSLLIKAVNVVQNYDMEKSGLALGIFLICLADFSIWLFGYKWADKKEKKLLLLISLGIIIFSSYPLLSTGITIGSDSIFHIFRVEGLKDGLLAGDFPVKLQPTWLEGYGYAVSVFYGDVFLYIPAILRIIGFPIQASFKIFLFLLNIMTYCIMYHCIYRIVKKVHIAVFCSAVYLLTPFRIFSLYHDMRIGEMLAYMLMPLLIYGFYRIYTEDVKKAEYKFLFIVPAVTFSLMINSHTLTTEVSVLFTVLGCLLLFRKTFCRETFFELIKTAITSILLSVGFLVPFIDYMMRDKYNIQQESMWIQGGGLQLNQLFQMFPTYDKDIKAFTASYDFMETPGMGVLGLLFLGIAVYIVSENRKKYKECFFLNIMGSIALFLTTCYFPWDSIRKWLENRNLDFFIDTLQRPSRFITVAAAFLVLGGALSIKETEDSPMLKKWHHEFLVLLGTVLIVTAGYQNNFIVNTKQQEKISDINKYEQRGTYSRDEYFLENTTYELTAVGINPDKGLSVSNFEKKNLDINFDVWNETNESKTVSLPVLGYYGYLAEGDHSSRLVVSKGVEDTLCVTIPPLYNGHVSVAFKEPVYWRMSELISGIIWLIVASVCIKYRKKYKRE